MSTMCSEDAITQEVTDRTPAEHAATVRESVLYDPLHREALAALDALEAQARENVDHAEALLTRDPFGEAERSLAATLLREALAAIERAETWAAGMERGLRELVDAVRVLDVMLREPAAEGLMSAEDYRSYLQGAWLGVDEKVEQARAALATDEEQA